MGVEAPPYLETFLRGLSNKLESGIDRLFSASSCPRLFGPFESATCSSLRKGAGTCLVLRNSWTGFGEGTLPSIDRTAVLEDVIKKPLANARAGMDTV